ncbi:sporulation peptidase YabG [Xylanibacillus composti]|uniref:Sporulation peptidase YabG n=1 Tax=Xylanibacillus composti TaxID=1572762 RepID=A0A8J4H1H4_9BACL|nr:sporulation peptidase YabG [Xylanibacillus composti]MDT9725158.1 sporulation peptidase YabG [Xylanibacillus composti]GIQ67269.1 sporulation peptidase YabG [Xylanibacillus composti]
MWKVGTYVTRKSYGNDMIFRIESINQEMAILRGVDYRLMADAPLEDLSEAEEPLHSDKSEVPDMQKRECQKIIEETKRRYMPFFRSAGTPEDKETFSYFEVPGKVLHLDGDPAYLRKSMDLYKHYQVPAEGHYVQESSMADLLYRLLPESRPDIVVITGHDGIFKDSRGENLYHLSSYKNSRHFVRAIRACREYERNRDVLTIVAGACQSHFEALLKAGANFASSPARILIHALDPVQVAARISYTSIKETITMMDVFDKTVSGVKGIGGIESKGSYRVGIPNFKHMQ